MSRTAPSVQQVLNAMAYRREQFKDKVEEKVGGALLEHYKAVLAEALGQSRWVTHWRGEVDRLLETELVVVLLHTIRGFKDRRKAATEVLEQLRAAAGKYETAARHTIRRDYKLPKEPGPVASADPEAFFRRVEEVIATHV